MPLDVSKYLDTRKKEVPINQVDVKPLFITLYIFLAANSILGIILNLFEVVPVKTVWMSLLFNVGLCLIAFLTYFFKKRCLLWLIFLINIFNPFLNLTLTFVYILPICIIIFTIYRNMGENYRYFINEDIENKILDTLSIVFSMLLYFIISFAWFCYYGYYEWSIIRESFWQFFNPFSYLWAFGLMFKSVNTYVYANITVVMWCLFACILASQEFNEKRQNIKENDFNVNKEEFPTTSGLKSTKKNFLRFLKCKYLKYKKYQRKQNKIKTQTERIGLIYSQKVKNEEIERKETTKHKGRFVLSKNLTFIVITLIIAFSYIFVEQNKINYKEKIRIERETSEKIQQEAYENCMKNTEANYLYNWNRACKSLKKKNDCLLPTYRADSIEKWRNEEETNCMNKLKNKAFKEYELEE